MSMLYIWQPFLGEEKTKLELIITRGDSDQVGNGSTDFVASVLKSAGVSSIPEKWSIESYRCNFYSEYWQEEGWKSRWDYLWRLCAHFAKPANTPELKAPYVGIDEIDDYSPLVESYKQPPYKCLVIAQYASEKQAQTAARKIAEDREIAAAGEAAGASDRVIDVVLLNPKQVQVRAFLGAGDEAFFDSGYPDKVVAMLETCGGITHIQS